MNKEKLKRQVSHQSGEAFGQFLATSMVAIVQHDDPFETAPLNLATDLVALNGFPGGWFHHEGRKYIQFTSLTFVTLCDQTDQWHRPINLDVQIEVGYPDIVQEADTNQHIEMPDVEGMSGGGMWVLNINPRRLW